jgi:hypothetical protein
MAFDGSKDLGRLGNETTLSTGADPAVRHELGQQPGIILTSDQRVRVFISSTLEELAAERAAGDRPAAPGPSVV